VRVAHVSCHLDPERRSPAQLLDAWPTLVDVAAAVARSGGEVTVVQAAHQDAELDRSGVRFRFVRERHPPRWRRRFGAWATPAQPRLIGVLRQLEPQVVHVHSLSFPRHAAHIRRALPAARLLVQDHADHPPRGWRMALARNGLAHVDAFAFTAAAQAVPFREAGMLPAGARIFEIPESSSTFTPGDREQARRATGMHGDPCLLWLGHLDGNKDPLTVLEALRLAARDLPGARLWMAYRKAPMLTQVSAMLDRDAELAARVHLLGPQPHDRVELMLRAADFLVQASHVEGSGYAVIEALAAGTPPLVTDIPSFRMLTAQGRVGALFPTGSAVALHEALLRRAAGSREEQRRSAREHFACELSFDAIGRKLSDAYAALLS
jgi:glycosyltransferase involved in cell wall biosynthesis